MTIDEAIKEFTGWAKDNRKEQNYWAAERNESYDEANPLSYADCEGFERDAEERAEYHEQLAEWLTELKEAKRLLKLAVEDLSCGGENNKCTKSCKTCTHSSIKGYGCRYYGEYHWRYADEALKLVGGNR